MKYALIITGLLAGIAIMAPKLVVLGYFLLILPGLILTAAPTVFIYLAATAVIRQLLPLSSPQTATVVAFGIALLIGWAVMQPFRFKAIADFRANELPDVLSNQLFELDRNVRIERPDHRHDPECDYLTLALLDSPLVKSVTTATAGRGKPSDTLLSAVYTLESAKVNAEAGISPSQPGQIVRRYLPLIRKTRGQKLISAVKAVEANWAIRLTGNERLREVKPVEVEKADWVIHIDNKPTYSKSVLNRVTIVDSQGTVRFRKSYRKQAVPARIFYLGFHADMSAGQLSDASFHLGHQIMESGQSSLKPESTLLQAVKFTIPPYDSEILEVVREKVTQTLDDPAATPARLDLARRYLGLFFFDTKPRDHLLIARIVAEDRVRDIDTQIKNVFSKGKTPTAMRNAYVKRIAMDQTSADLRHWLAERLANLPPGTFAKPNPAYLAIWDSPTTYQEAAPLIATLADMSPEKAMPMLDKILDVAVELPRWHERRAIVNGIQSAFIRLGSHASDAAPRIKELFLQRPSPIMNNSKDAAQWRFALARMGVALEDLPVFANQSPETVERNLRQVITKLKRYERANAAEKNP